MGKCDIGLIGLGVMGANLARNMERNGFSVAVYNRSTEVTEKFMHEFGAGHNFFAARTTDELLENLARPRKVVILVKAGAAVDAVLTQLLPKLEPGDIPIDGGNSLFKDTRRREAELATKGIQFVGSGVSGGEEGALWGPSLMPGGARSAYEQIESIWNKISAKTEDGPCSTYVGEDGSGHFVKMVHNGIEYGDMQLIAEAYDLLRRVTKLKAEELAAVFEKWNQGALQSFLIEITVKIFRRIDEKTKRPLVDLVLDKAGQKGTGRWTVESALELGVPTPTLNAAVEARIVSSMKEERVAASRALANETLPSFDGNREKFIAAVHDALYASKICCYAQGMALIQAAAKEYKWSVNLSELARIWKGGCIIRAKFLDTIKEAYRRNPNLPNLLLDPEFKKRIGESLGAWREVARTAVAFGIPVPAMGASIAYYDSYRTADLPQNLTQAQRDFFGAHTYERVDEPELGFVHSDWG
jgi:6-phosphogluconate dehydrogenase